MYKFFDTVTVEIKTDVFVENDIDLDLSQDDLDNLVHEVYDHIMSAYGGSKISINGMVLMKEIEITINPPS